MRPGIHSLRFRIFIGLVALAVGGRAGNLPVAAQEASPVLPGKVERRNRAPVSGEILRVSLPKSIEARLSNGLTVLVLEDRRFPHVVARLHLGGAGALFEPKELPGLAAATASMLREGTRNRTGSEIARVLDRLGASVSAEASFGSTYAVLSASGLSENFDSWFTLALEMVLEPEFPEHELNRFKRRARVELRQQRASARFLAGERFHAAVFGAHPAAVIGPTLASIDALSPELLRKWHRERYSPRNSVLALAGDVTPSALLPKLEGWLRDWRAEPLNLELPPNPAPAPARKIYLVDRPNSVQTTLTIGTIALDRKSNDYVSMVVMNQILGSGPASRLFLNLREEKGYTYGVYSRFTASEYPGPWSAGTQVRSEVTAGALTELFNEIKRMRETPVTEAELASAKRAVVARLALALERPDTVLDFALTRRLYGLPEDYWDLYPKRIAAVTAADVQRVARKYLDPDRMQVVAVGDGRKIKAMLEKFGPVEVFDSDGKVLLP